MENHNPNNILITNYRYKDKINIYGILPNNKFFTIIISENKYKYNDFNKLRMNNYSIFIPVNINNEEIEGYNINLEIDRNNNILNKYQIKLNKFNYNNILFFINCKISSVVWIIVNSMLIQFCKLNNYNVTGFMTNDSNEFYISGNNNKIHYHIEKKQFNYDLSKYQDSNIKQSEEKIFIPSHIINNQLKGVLITTTFKIYQEEDILYKSIEDYPFDAQYISPIQHMILRGCIYSEL